MISLPEIRIECQHIKSIWHRYRKYKCMHLLLSKVLWIFFQLLVCVMSACKLQHMKSIEALLCQNSEREWEQQISLILFPLCCVQHDPQTATPSLQQHEPLSVGFIMWHTQAGVNPSKSPVAFTVQRQITGAYFNASQSSLQCLCGNLALLTHYLKSLGLLSSSGMERSLHTSCSQADSLCSYPARADPRLVLEIRRRGGRVPSRNGQKAERGEGEHTLIGSENERVRARNDGGE